MTKVPHLKKVSPAGPVPTLWFLGATDTANGHRTLLSTAGHNVLIDCGLFQGSKDLRLRNWEAFQIKPQSINAVLLTNAHLNQSGYLPVLCRDGFSGRIFASQGTFALCRILLLDNARLQEEEADYANRKGYSKRTPATPLYTEKDALRVLQHFQPIAAGTTVEVVPGVRASFRASGYIVGASSVMVQLSSPRTRRIFFSGALGRPNHPILRPPQPMPACDIAVVESAHGDHLHDDADSMARFERTLVNTIRRGGIVVVPAFAVDQTALVLTHLRSLMKTGRVPPVPVYVDSPMALAALGVWREAIAAEGPEIQPGLNPQAEDLFDPGELVEVRTVEESIALNERPGPHIIIAASGMATGGRVLYHLIRNLSDERSSVMLVGFQAAGTRGRLLADGARILKLLGRHVTVKCEVAVIPAFSALADRNESLSWMKAAPRPPEMVYAIGGEPKASADLCKALARELGWSAVNPHFLEKVRVD